MPESAPSMEIKPSSKNCDVVPAVESVGIAYFENPLMPGKPMFRCEKLAATLTAQSCAGMWQQAHERVAVERLGRCKGCQIGAKHAGAGDVALNPIRGMELCVRCGRTDLRLVRGLICVSCANREYEAIKGANAKGAPPRKHPGMKVVGVRYAVEGQAMELRRLAVGAGELVVQLLRDEPKRVVFGMGRVNAAG